MEGVILLVGDLEWYVRKYCEFRDYVLGYLTVEFCSDVKPVVDVFRVSDVFLFEPNVFDEGNCYRVVYVPRLLYDSPGENVLFEFFREYSEAVVKKELFEGTYNLTEGDFLREEIIKRLRHLATSVKTRLR